MLWHFTYSYLFCLGFKSKTRAKSWSYSLYSMGPHAPWEWPQQIEEKVRLLRIRPGRALRRNRRIIFLYLLLAVYLTALLKDLDTSHWVFATKHILSYNLSRRSIINSSVCFILFLAHKLIPIQNFILVKQHNKSYVVLDIYKFALRALNTSLKSHKQ